MLRGWTLITALMALGLTASCATARQTGGMPLAEVLELAKPYPNLLLEVRLQLLRAGLKREQVTCVSERLDAAWAGLANRRMAPYTCAIGKRTLHISATSHYYDGKGRRLDARTAAIAGRAAKMTETHFKWQWR